MWTLHSQVLKSNLYEETNCQILFYWLLEKENWNIIYLELFRSYHINKKKIEWGRKKIIEREISVNTWNIQ